MESFLRQHHTKSPSLRTNPKICCNNNMLLTALIRVLNHVPAATKLSYNSGSGLMGAANKTGAGNASSTPHSTF